MAKRELSSALKNLKFMQRAAQRQEKVKKEEDDVKPDKMNKEAQNVHEHAASATDSSTHGGRTPLSEPGTLSNEADHSEGGQHSENNGDHKRKQPDPVSGPQYPNKLPKSNQAEQKSSPHYNKASGFKQPKREKLNWSVLRPPKLENRKAKQ